MKSPISTTTRNVALAALLSCALAGTAAAQSTGAGALPRPQTVTIDTVTVAQPNNPPVWIIPFYNDVYQSQASCLAALPGVMAAAQAAPDPSVQKESATQCMRVGGVPYAFNIGETEVTVAQWVAFLNTVDPLGSNAHHIWDAAESSTVWPKYGSINRNRRAAPGKHYVVASPDWARKPYNSSDFPRAARFINSLENGTVLSKSTRIVTTVSGSKLRRTRYTVRLSRITETGMYTLTNRAATRNQARRGFVVPSQNEWIKAAYFDPKGGGKFSYWDYPTNPGTFVNCPVDVSGCAEGGQPNATVLNPVTGAVTNAGTQPLATFAAVPGTAPDWCPGQFTPTQCAQTPFTNSPITYNGNLSTVGQALTRSPWGTLDQGGNVVEITDTIAPPPAADKGKLVWRRWHGGVVTATAYQMWISAVGVTPQIIPGYAVNPWRGLRIGVLGK
jgi:hypothetical protein